MKLLAKQLLTNAVREMHKLKNTVYKVQQL